MTKVLHFGGMVECNTIEILDSILNVRYGRNVNEFWISGEREIPCLAMLVNGNYANLTFFPEDGHPGFQSAAKDTNLKLDDVTIFCTNTPYEEIEIKNDAVVTFAIALNAAREYYTTKEMPSCIEWVEM